MCSFSQLCVNLCRLSGQNLLPCIKGTAEQPSLVGFYQIEAADNKNTDNDSETCRACVQRGGHYGILSRIVDTSNDDFLCS